MERTCGGKDWVEGGTSGDIVYRGTFEAIDSANGESADGAFADECGVCGETPAPWRREVDDAGQGSIAVGRNWTLCAVCNTLAEGGDATLLAERNRDSPRDVAELVGRALAQSQSKAHNGSIED